LVTIGCEALETMKPLRSNCEVRSRLAMSSGQGARNDDMRKLIELL